MPRLTISRAISWLADRHPEAISVRDDDCTLTWRELDLRTNRLARAYAELGVGVDSLVTVALPNSVEFVESCVAIWKLGATPQPLSSRLPAAERDAVLGLVRPALVVGLVGDQADPAAHVPAAPAAHALAPPLPAPPLPAAPTPPSGSPPPAAPSLPPGFEPSPGLSDGALPDAAAASWKAPTSSGSTGRPKLVLAAASAHIDPEAPVASFIPQRAVQLVAGPLFHSAPFTYAMRGLLTGHTLVILPRFDERRVLDTVSEHGITWMPLVPTMMSRIWRLPAETRAAADLSSLESILHIGSPCAPWLKRAWIDWLGPDRVTEVYAGTESQGLTTLSGREWLEHPGSVGRPAAGSEMQVWGPDDRPLPPGETGRIMMRRSGGATYSYRGGPPPRPDGWDTLGDLGHLDSDGYLYLADRADDLIITGGVNVYPAEVEGVLEQHPGIRSAVVFGVPDDDLGMIVCALVDVGGAVPTGEEGSEPAPTAVPTELELREWVRNRLDSEKRPRLLEFTTTPVRDDAGKVRRHRLRDRVLESRIPPA